MLFFGLGLHLWCKSRGLWFGERLSVRALNQHNHTEKHKGQSESR